MKRFFRWLKALFNRGMDKVEDPDLMLDQARRDMQEALSQNRERAVNAITMRNKLQQLFDSETAKSRQLEKQAEMALKQGNREVARQLIREKQTTDAGLENLGASLSQANETVDNIKVAIKRQQEEVRKKVSESLALKSQWQQAKIQNSITQALEGLTFENEYEGSFAAARDKIQTKMAEANARQEMYGESLAGKTMAMQDMAMDAQADEELQKLEARLGLSSAEPVKTESGAITSVEDELAELEKRIGQSDTNSS